MLLFLSGVGPDLPIGQRSGNMAANVGAPPARHPCLHCPHQTRQKHRDRWKKTNLPYSHANPFKELIFFCLFIIKTCNLLCMSRQQRGTPQSTTSAAPVDLATRVPWWVFLTPILSDFASHVDWMCSGKRLLTLPPHNIPLRPVANIH